MATITLNEIKYIKNPDTKTTYIVDSEKVEQITEEQHANYFDSVKFFRNLGGKETITKSYTCRGFKATKLISVSPDKQTKVVREFSFKSN